MRKQRVCGERTLPLTLTLRPSLPQALCRQTRKQSPSMAAQAAQVVLLTSKADRPEVHFSGPISVHLPQADDYYKIMDFVSPLNFFPRQQQVYETWQKDTGTWLLEHPKFLEWQIGTPAVLWCSGILTIQLDLEKLFLLHWLFII
ncbi:hypothetical protein HMN09_01078700 [Mycena chlorophos]|uniref:Uncharacterized protein n=1 Tax=Mycena chlorophos TaxID=658473 RepID=A0A8H6SDF7_MYCCL|nr:hypothetical protein HMN09_01078700 [Mycena chlorophos]